MSIRMHLAAAVVLSSMLAPGLAAAPPAGAALRSRPDPASVRRFGAGHRYPQAGWIVVHIEGTPYERGYQHGRLLAPEIAKLVRALAAYRSPAAPADAWRDLRLVANALFLRKFDAEYLEEMKGIADGAAAAGAGFEGRPLDLLDVVTLNADIETTFLDEALDATATGLEGRVFREPAEGGPRPPREGHCSAFAAVGPATADGRVVFGHITMWNLYHAAHYNVWLDIQPSRGHRVVMQTYPGGVMSGLDYYMNDAGLVVCETTLDQTRFDPAGIPLVDRIRRALQYADSIDGAVKILREGNNGLYTNEWLLADTRANEVAMFELGTGRSRLWRSRDNDWFGGTAGFYWGCNNAKDLQVRLETVPGLGGKPANPVFRPSDRDRAWLRLFDRSAGSIDQDFGRLAFTTPPLAAAPSLDAKYTTAAMAGELATWARFGPPAGGSREPTASEIRRFPDMAPLVADDWTILRVGDPGAGAGGTPTAVDLGRIASAGGGGGDRERPPAWHGTILPKAEADTWLSAAFADYERIVSLERAVAADRPGPGGRDRVDLALFAPTSAYLSAVARRGGKDVPLSETRAELRSSDWYDIASGKGVLVLHALRKVMGDGPFLKMMDEFGRAHAGRPADTAEFFAAAEASHGSSLAELRSAWLNGEALARLGPDAGARHASGRFWAVDSFEHEPESALIVYGTLAEADAQREAASILRTKLARRWANVMLPVKPDVELTDADLKANHVLLVGRPSTNRAVARLAEALPVRFGPASFTLRGETYAHPLTLVAAAGPNPAAPGRSVVAFAGLSAAGTWRGIRRLPDRGGLAAEVVVMEDGESPRLLTVPPAAPAGVTSR